MCAQNIQLTLLKQQLTQYFFSTMVECILTEIQGIFMIPAVCFSTPVLGVSPPQLNGSDKHTRGCQ